MSQPNTPKTPSSQPESPKSTSNESIVPREANPNTNRVDIGILAAKITKLIEPDPGKK